MVRTLILIGIAIVAFLILNPFVIVGPGERGVLLNFGAVQDKVLGEGGPIVIPDGDFSVDRDGRIKFNGEQVAKIAVVNFEKFDKFLLEGKCIFKKWEEILPL